MDAYLFDLPIQYFRLACVTDGQFDPEKAAALGYSEAQFAAIQEAVATESPSVAAEVAVESEATE